MVKTRQRVPGNSRRRLLVTVAALAIVGAAAWVIIARGRSATSATGTSLGRVIGGVPQDQLNVVVITLDTTRWDRLGAYGDGAAVTPNLDRLAAEGVLFEQAIAAAPLTLPAHSTIFTGLLPPKHGVRDNGGYVLDGKHATLAGILKDGGWQTGAFVGAFVLDSKWGLNHGFDTYVDKFDVSKYKSISLGDVARRAGEVVDNALPWLDQHASQRFFAWLHFYDAHSPYDPPEPFKSRFADRPYAGEIAYVDDQIGRVLQWLDSRGLTGRTIVVGDWRPRREPERTRRGHARALHLRCDDARAFHRARAVHGDPGAPRAGGRPQRGRDADDPRSGRPAVAEGGAGPQPRPAADRRGAGPESRCLQRVALRTEPLRVERAAVAPVWPVQVHLDDAAGAVRPGTRSGRAEEPVRRAPSARRSDGGRARAVLQRGGRARGARPPWIRKRASGSPRSATSDRSLTRRAAPEKPSRIPRTRSTSST